MQGAQGPEFEEEPQAISMHTEFKEPSPWEGGLVKAAFLGTGVLQGQTNPRSINFLRLL